MRDEFSKHQCLGQEWRRLLEAAEKTVSRSFLSLEFVVSQSVMPVEMFCCFAGQRASWRECVVVFKFVIIITIIIIIIIIIIIVLRMRRLHCSIDIIPPPPQQTTNNSGLFHCIFF